MFSCQVVSWTIRSGRRNSGPIRWPRRRQTSVEQVPSKRPKLVQGERPSTGSTRPNKSKGTMSHRVIQRRRRIVSCRLACRSRKPLHLIRLWPKAATRTPRSSKRRPARTPPRKPRRSTNTPKPSGRSTDRPAIRNASGSAAGWSACSGATISIPPFAISIFTTVSAVRAAISRRRSAAWFCIPTPSIRRPPTA